MNDIRAKKPSQVLKSLQYDLDSSFREGRWWRGGGGLSHSTEEHSGSSLCPEHLTQPALSIRNFFTYLK